MNGYEILGLERDVFFDKNKVKIIDGIAGSAKSSAVDSIFVSEGVPYARFTSTHKLKYEANERFSSVNKTIAGGMFITEDGKFYSKDRDIGYENIVIDEILQSDMRVFDWIGYSIGKYNIVVCTDSKQMLNPTNGRVLLDYLNVMKKKDFVVNVGLSKSYRPRNVETEEIFEKAYSSNSDGYDLFDEMCEQIHFMNFDDLSWNSDWCYICHTNELERLVYDKFGLYNNYDIPLINKGVLANKEVRDKRKYAILPQELVDDKMTSYLQAANVATPVRYQGSEVKAGRRCFFLVDNESKVTNREFYTVLTRVQDINDMCIVYKERQHKEEMTMFNGKPVIPLVVADLPDTAGSLEVEDGVTLDSVISLSRDKKSVKVPAKFIQKTARQLNNFQGVCAFDDKHLRYKGVLLRPKVDDEDGYILNSEGKLSVGKTSTSRTVYSLIRREGVFQYNYIAEAYRALISSQEKYFGRVKRDWFSSASYVSHENKAKSEYKYALDLKSSYPHILCFFKMPILGRWYNEKQNNDNTIDWYLSGTCESISDMCICTGEYVDFSRQNNLNDDFYYIGSCSSMIGSKMGTWLHEQAHRSVESNQRIKGMHYGLMNRQYVSPASRDPYTGEALNYTVYEHDDRILLFCAICSHQLLIMNSYREFIYGDVRHGGVNIDCVYFDYEGDTTELGISLSKIYPNVDFRISLNDGSNEIVYKTYKDLVTEKELKRLDSQERRRMAKEQKEKQAVICSDTKE